jgi:hypothetical protein
VPEKFFPSKTAEKRLTQTPTQVEIIKKIERRIVDFFGLLAF